MWEQLRDHPSALAVAAGLHVLLALFLVVGIKLSNRPVAPPAFTPVDIVEAIAIDGREFDKAQRRRDLEEQRQRQAALDAKRKAAAEKKRQAELKRQREEQARQKAEAEKRRQVELKRQREERAREKAEAEKKRQAELKRQKEEAERQRLAKLKAEEKAAEQRLREQQMAEEEARIAAQLKAEQERLAAIKAEREAEDERRRAAALQRELARYRNDYVNAITAAIERSWLRPPGERRGQVAVILVQQTPGGFIQSVSIKKCLGSDPFCRSVEAAVWKAEPLPQPPRPEVFERQLEIIFEPDNP